MGAMTKGLPSLLLALAAFGLSAGCIAADPQAALPTVQQVCQACHGMDGNSPIADNPKIGGQYPDYLAKALRDYHSGVRRHAVMNAMAQNLTPKQIEDLAAYYASQPAVLVTKH
jgi:cytochrome c553